MTPVPEERLKSLVFRLEWMEGDVLYQGTGFFISRSGAALTAFHNIPAEVRSDPDLLLYARYRGTTIPFRWALPGDQDRAWQAATDVAVLQLESEVVTVPEPLELRYLRASATQRRRNKWWDSQPVASFGFPVSASAEGQLVQGTVNHGNPLVEIEIEGRARSEYRFAVLSDDFQGGSEQYGAQGLSGSPLWDRERQAITGVVNHGLHSKGRLYATDVANVVRNLPRDYARYFQEQGGTMWRWLAAAGSAVVVLVMTFWVLFGAGRLPPGRDSAQPEIRVQRVAGTSIDTPWALFETRNDLPGKRPNPAPSGVAF